MNHSFNIEIAKQIGVEKAILLEYFTFWIEKNIANNSNIHDGKAYTYNSYEALAVLFPYMKLNTIKRCIREMENDGILESRTDLNATAYDKTKWYTLGSHSIVKKITIGEDKNNDRVVEKSLSIMNNNHRQLHTQLHTTVTVDKKRKKEKNSPDDVDEFKNQLLNLK